MKRFLKFVVISIIIVVLAFKVFKLSEEYKIETLKSNIDWSVYYKNCKDSVGFDRDKNENTYIAYKNYIKVIKKNGKEETIFKNDSLNIENLLFFNDKLYFISGENLYEYNLINNKLACILEGIPSKGKYLDRNLIIKDSKLLLSIGSVTNSGIASYDQKENSNNIPYDKSSIDIVLNGFNYGEKNTGAFMPYGNSSQEGQRVNAEKIGNSCIIEIDLESNKFLLYATGIRNVAGWDIDSNNNLIGIIGGMENIQSRPINRDFDYLYKLDKGKWYGWPDFSGGDPITSPRFKGDKLVSNLISNPPNKIVPSPIYQYSDVGNIKYLAIDTEGKILGENSKVYLNIKENSICSINNESVIWNLLKLKNNSNIKGIKYFQGNIYILDSGIGCIYKLQSNRFALKFDLPTPILVFILIFLLTLIILCIGKFYYKKTLFKR